MDFQVVLLALQEISSSFYASLGRRRIVVSVAYLGGENKEKHEGKMEGQQKEILSVSFSMAKPEAYGAITRGPQRVKVAKNEQTSVRLNGHYKLLLTVHQWRQQSTVGYLGLVLVLLNSLCARVLKRFINRSY